METGGQEPPLLNAARHDPTPIRGRSRRYERLEAAGTVRLEA